MKVAGRVKPRLRDLLAALTAEFTAEAVTFRRGGRDGTTALVTAFT